MRDPSIAPARARTQKRIPMMSWVRQRPVWPGRIFLAHSPLHTLQVHPGGSEQLGHKTPQFVEVLLLFLHPQVRKAGVVGIGSAINIGT